MTRALVALAGILGAVGVGLGAYGAHGLEAALAGAEDVAQRLEWWRTAVFYHLIHVLAVAFTAWLGTRVEGKAPAVAGICFLAGVGLFSGTLYAMSLGAPRGLGAVTPVGGLALITGWVVVAWSARRSWR